MTQEAKVCEAPASSGGWLSWRRLVPAVTPYLCVNDHRPLQVYRRRSGRNSTIQCLVMAS
ncbi:hypothetical protein E2C01_022229 [Portunus trituberculatus]|uniref:Uncharacterized protein n=1 Tax=Portunus trituberculatus TaxID=210409 RepID=A0A5B7E744_PORTR|nr:hypothetical protein [Portunus trituberculatus]